MPNREPGTMQTQPSKRPRLTSRSSFPLFSDGDIIINITPTRCYKLHADVLSRSSPTFDILLRRETAARQSRRAETRAKFTIHHLTLIKNPQAGQSDQPDHIFERWRVEEDLKGLERARPALVDSQENADSSFHLVQAWDTILESFYGRGINIGDASRNTLAELLHAGRGLLKVAEYLQCVSVVTAPVESALLSAGQELHRNIARVPTHFLSLAYRLRSNVIFREALIHSAGQYRTAAVQEVVVERRLPDNLLNLLATKGKLLIEGSQRVQQKLLTYYPDSLQRPSTIRRADRDGIGRNSYGEDILKWMALVVFRQWQAQMMNNNKTHHAEDLGFRCLNLIAEGGTQYLTENDMHQFHQGFPMSDRAKNVLASHLTALKDGCKSFVAEMLQNKSMLDTKAHPVEYFTSLAVTEDDYPWDQGGMV